MSRNLLFLIRIKQLIHLTKLAEELLLAYKRSQKQKKVFSLLVKYQSRQEGTNSVSLCWVFPLRQRLIIQCFAK